MEFIVEEFIYESIDNMPIYAKCWKIRNPKGIIQIAHGLGETSEYYLELARYATNQGYSVYINEERGQGRTGGKKNAGNAGRNSFYYMVEDIHVLTTIIKDCTDVPIYLIGHSLGSTLVQLYVEKYQNLISGVILIGLPKIQNTDELLESIKREIGEKGEKSPSHETFEKIFSNVNDQFEPVRTVLDWITSDTKKINYFLKLPYTNVLFNNRFYMDFILALIKTQAAEYIKKFPKELPILLLAGSEDVLNRNGRLVKKHYEELIKNGVRNAQYKIYENMRHSILQERKRNVVERDILDWIKIMSLLRNNRELDNEIKMGMV